MVRNPSPRGHHIEATAIPTRIEKWDEAHIARIAHNVTEVENETAPRIRGESDRNQMATTRGLMTLPFSQMLRLIVTRKSMEILHRQRISVVIEMTRTTIVTENGRGMIVLD